MDCKFYLCLLVIMLGTITVQGAPQDFLEESEEDKRYTVNCHHEHGSCHYGRCPSGTRFCGYDTNPQHGCGVPPNMCCCRR
ncbi:small cysteine-rich protein 1-like [Oculina patagonica]